MNKNEIKGKVDQAKGNIKEGFGKMTGNSTAELKGKAEQAKGRVEEGLGHAKEKMSHGINRELDKNDSNV